MDEIRRLAPTGLAAVVTYLQMHDLPSQDAALLEREGVALRRRVEWPVSDYRRLYRRIGTDWLWFSRLRMPDGELDAILRDPRVEVYTLSCPGEQACGLLELDCRHPGEIELAFLGIVPERLGQGYGACLLAHAIERARRHAPARLWLHTCTHDHPRALPFYRAAGFVPYASAVEITVDPRLDGTLPRDAAPHVPLVDATPQP